jgi:hypothetical protein
MKRPIDYRLIGEIVSVDNIDQENKGQQKLGKVLSITPEYNTVLIELLDGTQAEFKKEQLLHLYPKGVIMQGLVSNFEMSRENFKKILQVARLISQKRNAEALQVAVSNEVIKFFCTTDCKSWLELLEEALKNKRSKHLKKKK